MPTFSYIGQDMNGKEKRGTIDGFSAEDAREKLRKQGLSIDQVKYLPPQQAAPAKPSNPVGFTTVAEPAKTAAPVKAAPKPVAAPAKTEAADEEAYIPLVDTFRLYAGWLLAWYSIVYLLGYYQSAGRLPFQVPFLEGLFLSPLVLKFAFGTFLFLMLSSIHRAMGRGLGKGVALTAVWIALVAMFSLNV